MAERGERLTIGRFGAPYGVQGWLRVHSYTSPPENIVSYSPWWVARDGRWESIRIDAGGPRGSGLAVHIEGIDDREAARALVGSEIAIERDLLEPPAEGEYYWADLIGATVTNLDGRVLGRVDHLIATGANDVLVVAGDRERLIPFVRERFIIEVDVEAGRILVDWNPED